MFFYSAQIHLRKVLNRVHTDLYKVESKASKTFSLGKMLIIPLKGQQGSNTANPGSATNAALALSADLLCHRLHLYWLLPSQPLPITSLRIISLLPSTVASQVMFCLNFNSCRAIKYNLRQVLRLIAKVAQMLYSLILPNPSHGALNLFCKILPRPW
jgi:hypothetical protein